MWGNSNKQNNADPIELSKRYCTIVCDQLEDQAIKIIWYNLLRASFKAMENYFFNLFPSENLLCYLLEEQEDLKLRRFELRKKITNYKQVLHLLGEVEQPRVNLINLT